ncbi:MAG: penicillin acylase family protein [Ignavibacteriales bacterium]|nr:penicillin acylase family protein [Ignavibacteriales bacterium]
MLQDIGTRNAEKTAKSKAFASIAAFAATAIVAYVALDYMLDRSLPSPEEEYRAAELRGTITVYHDSLGIPAIYADDELDAAFALGFLHARDRMFQMEVSRRAAEGRLSEIFGKQTLEFDRLFRVVGIARIAERLLTEVDSSTIDLLEAYSAGVNFFLDETDLTLSIEFDALNHEPEPWKPAHSLMIARMMGWELNINWYHDLVMGSLERTLDPALAASIAPYDGTIPPSAGAKSPAPVTTPADREPPRRRAREDDPNEAPNVGAPESDDSPSADTSSIASGFLRVAREYRAFRGTRGTTIGSNNWAVSGARAVNGKPIIANDPHLAFQAPGKWYFAIIRAGDWNAEGVTIPGAPGVVIGKNKRVAWAFTNVMSDETDFYLETLDSSGRFYLYDGKYRPIAVETDTIAVRDSSDAVVKIRRTTHGPIVSDIGYAARGGSDTVREALSMRWLGFESSDEIGAIYKMNLASNWEEFVASLESFATPAQNFLYADADGNVGWITGGRFPDRGGTPPFIYDGTDAANDWRGFIPFERNPRLFNPDSGVIATANTAPLVDPGFYVSAAYAATSRFDRIHELLGAKEKHSEADLRRVQIDVVSPLAREIRQYILDAFERVEVADDNLEIALLLFRDWQGDMDAYSQAAAIYSVFMKRFVDNVYRDDLGDDLFTEFCYIANTPYRSVRKILRENDSAIFDDRETPRYEGRDAMILKSFDEALDELEARLGSDPARWQWGRIHKLTFEHIFGGHSAALDRMFNVGPFGVGGDGTTPMNTEFSFGDRSPMGKTDAYQALVGPSVRYVYDFSTPSVLRVSLPMGQSGNILSEHYRDTTPLWLAGDYFTITLDDASLRNPRARKTTIMPL